MDVSKICRLCGEKTGENSRSLFDKGKNGLQLIQIIKQYIPILIYRTDPLSKKVCCRCFEDLNKYFDFLHRCVTVQENFKRDLSNQNQDDNIKLYLNTLENHKSDYLSTLYVSYCKNIPTKDFTCQLNTEDLNETPVQPAKRKFKILTPELINEISEIKSSMDQSLINGPPIKKRRLAGPKCKTRPQIYNPMTLLQCVLQKINEKICPQVNESYNDSLLTESNVSLHFYEPYNNRRLFNEALKLCEPNYSKVMANVNLTAPVDCNYCLKRFPNILELSKHEIKHILVDVGPKIESKTYMTRFKQFYNMYLRAQCSNVTLENGVATLDENCKFDVQSNLLVPEPSIESVFEVVNEEVYLNGKPLKDYDKNERKLYFKSIYVNGIKKKFCPICRHTFKDNWGIDWHYNNNSCQYTCKYCGLKFKYHKDLFPEHLKTHEGQACNKIFGPSDKKGGKRKKVKVIKRSNIFTNSQNPPKVKPIKMKQLFQRQAINTSLLKIKTEPDLDAPHQPGEILKMGDSSTNQPYQAYFCRKCFKVFFKIDEFNSHTRICRGAGSESEASSVDHSKSDTNSTTSKRPVRTCVRDFSIFNDSDSESLGSNSFQNSPHIPKDENAVQGYECGVCSSSFPSRHSRNSHMRIHKSQKIPADKVSNYLQKNISLQKQETVHKQVQNANLIRQLNEFHKLDITEPVQHVPPIRVGNLNPMVARLVQNNPHLTIRSYSKNPPDMHDQTNYQMPTQEQQMRMAELRTPETPKMGYRCGDCGGRFENKSLLYYHKMNNCVVKRNFECAFCKKKFGSKEHYNIHMLHVHPE